MYSRFQQHATAKCFSKSRLRARVQVGNGVFSELRPQGFSTRSRLRSEID